MIGKQRVADPPSGCDDAGRDSRDMVATPGSHLRGRQREREHQSRRYDDVGPKERALAQDRNDQQREQRGRKSERFQINSTAQTSRDGRCDNGQSGRHDQLSSVTTIDGGVITWSARSGLTAVPIEKNSVVCAPQE